MLELYINRLVPASGCDAITSEGICFRYFTSAGLNWAESKQECETRGYELAKVTSPEEERLMYSGVTDSGICYIGLNDLVNEGTFVWTDGSRSTYTPWGFTQPDNANDNEDCVDAISLGDWNDLPCSVMLSCYFCSTNGKTIYNKCNYNIGRLLFS